MAGRSLVRHFQLDKRANICARYLRPSDLNINAFKASTPARKEPAQPLTYT